MKHYFLSYSILIFGVSITYFFFPVHISLRPFQYAISCLGVWVILRQNPPQKAAESTENIFLYLTFALLILTSVSSFKSFYLNGIDFSIFEWMLNDKPYSPLMHSTIYDVNHLGIHPSWVLYLILPIYNLLPYSETLLVLNALIVWFSGYGMYKWGKSQGVDSTDALLLASSFWLSAIVGRVLQGGFRIETFYSLGLILFLISVQNRFSRHTFLATIFCLSIKEDAPLYVAPILILHGIFKKDYKNFVLGVSCILFMFIQIKYVQPFYLGNHSQKPEYLKFWRYLGEDIPSILSTALSQPYQVFKTVLFSHWWTLFIPFLGIPLFSLQTLIVCVPSIILLGSAASYPQMHQFENYYPYPLYSVICWGMLDVYKRLKQHRKTKIWQLACILAPLWHAGWIQLRPVRSDIQIEVSELKIWLQKHHKMKPTCAQPILFPHLGTDLNLHIDESKCEISILSTFLDPFPHTTEELENKIKSTQIIWKSDHLSVLKNPHNLF